MSDRVPKNPIKKRFSVFDISTGLSEFIHENFRGLATVSTDISSTGYVTLSEEYMTYLFKLILKLVYGRFLLYINISFDGDTLAFEIPFSEDLEISLRECAEISAAANSSDLDIEILNSGIRIFAKSEKGARIMSVYAGNIHEFKSALNSMFFGK